MIIKTLRKNLIALTKATIIVILTKTITNYKQF